jgi:DNA-binding NarL/FixJ family response regulator
MMSRRQSFATVVVGQSVLMREGIANLLHMANVTTLASVSSIEDLRFAKNHPRTILFIFILSSDNLSAVLEQVKQLKGRHQEARFAVVASYCRPSEMVSAFLAGVSGFFSDVVTPDVFIKSVELVMIGETIFPSAFTSHIVTPDNEIARRERPSSAPLLATDATPVQLLSPRERSILGHLIDGDSNKSIARKTGITEATVKVHVKTILRKVGVQNRTQAAIWGMNSGAL